MGAREVKALVAPQNPFALGAYPDRPAPAHVVNGFVAASLGTAPRGAAIRRFLGAKNTSPLESPELRLVRDDDAQDSGKIATLKADLSLIFNPDRRMWEEIGSLVPVHAALATFDPSDDGLGRVVWDLVRRHSPPDFNRSLRCLFAPQQAQDPVTACALILARDSETPSVSARSESDSGWYGPNGTFAGKLLGKRLTEVVGILSRPLDDARRLFQIQHLARGLYFVALWALLLGPLAASKRDKVATVDEIAAVVVWADTPPGPSDHPMVMASARTFQTLVERNSASLTSVLSDSLRTQKIPSRLPRGQRRAAAIRAQLLAGGLSASRISGAMERLCRDAEVTMEGDSPADPSWCGQVISSVYSPAILTRGFRSMGRKIGFIGPDRGYGAPRFLCETPLLGTLVAALCPPSGIDFETFVDRAREQLGLVFGPGTDDKGVERLALWEGAGIGRRLLVHNADALRGRLVRAGLAREYSDGHTEVFYDA